MTDKIDIDVIGWAYSDGEKCLVCSNGFILRFDNIDTLIKKAQEYAEEKNKIFFEYKWNGIEWIPKTEELEYKYTLKLEGKIV